MERYNYTLQEKRAYRLIADYCDFLKKCRKDYAPKSHEEEVNPLFTKSLTELDRFMSYRDIFLEGTKDERAKFMRDFNGVLSGIERILKKEKACQAVELA